ncbi:helix-turn-helix transcriptional regulator [Streptomyces sp. ST2-7A]|uniref:helix-turn-helix domain-containing protein n=1 Tax=Streptomyces sp. ST2-7A TaxID=2907214 RepID=UPI001F1E53C2|nr:helix-turn-helix transcriptional regulator [Streptomyces sp. ST2-7A]MCE7080647.1 helix-turn-helix transcriptional regulator [Streptomyces sp. ST2-7A]
MGSELRKLREQANRTATDAATHLGIDRAKISNIEAGYRGISPERLRNLAAFYRCDDQALLDALCAIAREQRGRHWWDSMRESVPQDALDLAEMEHHARHLHAVNMLLIPGIIQTPEYARAIFETRTPPFTPAEIEARVKFRTSRRRVFEKQHPPIYEIIIHEAALRIRYGGRRVHEKQLLRLTAPEPALPVTLRVIPFDLENVPGHAQSFLFTEGPVPQLNSVQVDTPFGGVIVHEAEEVENYRAVLGDVRRNSLPPEESRKLVQKIIEEI